jgi:hypothetical protein
MQWKDGKRYRDIERERDKCKMTFAIISFIGCKMGRKENMLFLLNGYV